MVCAEKIFIILSSHSVHVFKEADSDLVCQPGARWVDINDTLKKKGASLRRHISSADAHEQIFDV
jgi:FAD/FMN-containing dehydrogenase